MVNTGVANLKIVTKLSADICTGHDCSLFHVINEYSCRYRVKTNPIIHDLPGIFWNVTTSEEITNT